MKIQFEFDGVAGKKDIQQKIVKKFALLEKYLSNVGQDLKSAAVRVFKGERWGYKVRVDVKIPGKEVIAEAKSTKLLDAIDEVQHKAARIIRKYFDKLKDKRRRG